MHFTFDPLDLGTRHSFAIARAASVPVRRSIRVRVTDADGLEGWGEAPVTTPYYGETRETAMAVLPRLADAALQAAAGDPMALERVELEVNRTIGANPAAKTGISAALHDLLGKRLGLPLWRVWG